MYWSRKWKTHECKKCEYHGIPKNSQSVCVNSGDCTLRKHKREGVLTYNSLSKDVENNLFKNCSDCRFRTRASVIKSGMMPNINESKYSYDYRDYLKNKRKKTFEMKVPTKKTTDNTYTTQGYGGKCNNVLSDGTCIETNTISKKANNKYYKNSAVSSSSRLERLKLETINSEKRCKNDTSKCYGRYPNAASKRYGYKELFNENHKEINCPQFSARRRVLGNKKANNC